MKRSDNISENIKQHLEKVFNGKEEK